MAGTTLDDGHQDRHQAAGYRRIELITGESRRRVWDADEKARILAESFQPGAKVADVARRHGVSRGLLWTWRHQARKRGLDFERMFVPIRLMQEEAAGMRPSGDGKQAQGSAPTASDSGRDTTTSGTIEIEIGGACLRINGVVDAAVLRQVLLHFGHRP
jgi:transposase